MKSLVNIIVSHLKLLKQVFLSLSPFNFDTAVDFSSKDFSLVKKTQHTPNLDMENPIDVFIHVDQLDMDGSLSSLESSIRCYR